MFKRFLREFGHTYPSPQRDVNGGVLWSSNTLQPSHINKPRYVSGMS